MPSLKEIITTVKGAVRGKWNRENGTFIHESHSGTELPGEFRFNLNSALGCMVFLAGIFVVSLSIYLIFFTQAEQFSRDLASGEASISSYAQVLLIAIKVVSFYILIYFFIPYQILQFEKEHFLERAFICLVYSNFITIVIVHILAFMKLYETLSLLFCYLLSYIFYIWLKGRSPSAVADALGMKLVITMLDMSERSGGFARELGKHVRNWFNRHKEISVQLLRDFWLNPFKTIIPLVVIMVAAAIRFDYPLNHAAYTHIDSYLHLFWVKCLGSNQIYNDGIYPHGYHAVISALAKLTFLDPYWLCRFMGPLTGTLMVLSVYFFAFKITNSHTAGLVSLAVYGLVTHASFPAVVFRQTATLTQEYGAVFVLPGLYFLWQYFNERRARHLLLYGQALAITFFVHSYSALYLGIWSAVLALFAVIAGRLERKTLFKFAAAGAAAGAAGLFPFGVGFLMGKGFHSFSAQFVQESVTAGQAAPVTGGFLSKLITGSPFLDAGLLLALVLLISPLFIRSREWTVVAFSLSTCSLIMYFLFRARELNLPELSDPSRTTVFFSLILVVLYAKGFNLLEKLVRGITGNLRPRLLKAVSLLICAAVIYFYPPGVLFRGVEEYDEAAENYLVIKSSFPVLDWTVVGPPEQMYQVVGSGWHYEILRFVQHFGLDRAKDPDFKIPIPTNHIFFYTEKIPLKFGREVTGEDAEKDLEPEGPDPFMQYYHNKDQRAIVQAKAIRWMEAYRSAHTNVSIFFENKNMRIYYIYQPVKKA